MSTTHEVYIAGCGATPVGEYWELSLANLSARAMLAAIREAGGMRPQALYVGNLMASSLSEQANLGVKLADNAGLGGVETVTAEAGEASGAAALRLGYLAVRSGYVQSALVVGVEKVTDMVSPQVEAVLAQSCDFDFEAMQGLTPNGLAGLLMRRYMEMYDVPREAFGRLPLLAHAHAAHNANAMFRKAISMETYLRAPLGCDPLNLYDTAPYADGAAAVLLVNESYLPSLKDAEPIRVAASSAASDALALHDRPEPLAFEAAGLSARQALSKAGLDWQNMDIFELWDETSIYGLLSLEACGFAARGQAGGWLAKLEAKPAGRPALLTMGGNKGRGFPPGAAGVYQAVEAVLQLRGEAGANQVAGARTAMLQALGGPAATAFTHILRRES